MGESATTVTGPPTTCNLPSSPSKGSSTGSDRSRAVYPLSQASISANSSVDTELPVDDRSQTQVPNPKPIKVDSLAWQDSVAALLVVTPPQSGTKQWPEKYSGSTRSPSPSGSRTHSRRSSKPEGWKKYPELAYRKKTVNSRARV